MQVASGERITVFLKEFSKNFNYSADRGPIALFLGFFFLDVAMLALNLPLGITAIYAFIAFFPKSMITAWNHHHQHVPTFKSPILNMALEVMYGFQTGVLPNGWVLHHNLGHHPKYMKGAEDESAWKTSDGRTMGEIEYTLRVGLMAYPLIVRNIFRHDQKYGRRFLMGLILTAIVFLGFWLVDPVRALILFFLPAVAALFGTVWFTYKHHAGLDTCVAAEASWNVLDPLYNKLTGNLGYHTAHHISCGIHWSRLPELHDRISHNVPKSLYRDPGFPFNFFEAGLAISRSITPRLSVVKTLKQKIKL
jgi:fatty acid desaturase